MLEFIKNHDQIMKIYYILYKTNENQQKIIKINNNLQKINGKMNRKSMGVYRK